MPIVQAARRRELGPAHRRAPPDRGRRHPAPRGILAGHQGRHEDPGLVTGSPVLTPTGELQGIVLVARDVREMRQLLRDKRGGDRPPPQGRGGPPRGEGLDRDAARAGAHAAAARRAPRDARHARRRCRARAAQHRADPGRRGRRARSTALDGDEIPRSGSATSSPSSSASASTSRSTASGSCSSRGPAPIASRRSISTTSCATSRDAAACRQAAPRRDGARARRRAAHRHRQPHAHRADPRQPRHQRGRRDRHATAPSPSRSARPTTATA